MNIEMQTGGYALPVLHVDFNMMGGRRMCERRTCLPVLPDNWKLVDGQKVVLTDHDGNRCYGRVRHFKGKVVGVHAHLSTWQDGPTL